MTRHRESKDVYTSRIIKAGSLLADTKTLLAHWDLDESVQENVRRAQHENLFGKASRSRIEDILRIFRQRYLTDECVTRALVLLVKSRLSTESVDRILYFHAAQADPLLRDTVTEFLFPLMQQGRSDIRIDGLETTLSKWVSQGKTGSVWSEYTARRVAQGLLATLRDFGVLEGAVRKSISPVYLPTSAFCYIAFYLKGHHRSGEQLLEDPFWRLFFLLHDAVERFFFEAHQDGLLDYHAAGPVIRVDFPEDTLESYANALAARTT